MKKISMYMLLSFILVGLMACSNDNAAESNQNEANQTNNEEETTAPEKVEFDVEVEADDEELDKEEVKEAKSVTKQAVMALATGKVNDEFYHQFSDRQVNTIHDMLQEGSDEVPEEELQEKFLHTYVQLSDKVQAFMETNGTIDKVVIQQIAKGELELEENTQQTLEIEAELRAGEETFPLNISLDVNDGAYEYVHLDSPST